MSFASNGAKVTGGATAETSLNITMPTDFSIEGVLTEPNSPNGWTGAVHGFGVGFVCNKNNVYFYNDITEAYVTQSITMHTNDTFKIVVENGTAKCYYNDSLMQTVTLDATSRPFTIFGSPSNNYYVRVKDIVIKQL